MCLFSHTTAHKSCFERIELACMHGSLQQFLFYYLAVSEWLDVLWYEAKRGAIITIQANIPAAPNVVPKKGGKNMKTKSRSTCRSLLMSTCSPFPVCLRPKQQMCWFSIIMHHRSGCCICDGHLGAAMGSSFFLQADGSASSELPVAPTL